MKKIISIFILMILLFSCNNEEQVVDSVKLKIQLVNKQLKSFTNFKIIVTELQTGNIINNTFNNKGLIELNLTLGSYDFKVEQVIDGVKKMYGYKKNYTLKTDSEIKLEVNSVVLSQAKTFVLDELYFNGADNGLSWKGKTFYEQYFTIRNISDKPLYADGLSVGIVADYNALAKNDEFDAVLPQNLFLSQFYTIPGDGKTYKVEPNKSLVIARSAINHNENNDRPKSLNLSGADFEIYVPHQYSMTVDNPEVTNLIVDYSSFQAFSWQYSGASPIILFRLKENHQTFFKDNNVNLPIPGSFGKMRANYLKLPTSLIIDGVETGAKELFYRKVLPNVIDISSIKIEVASMNDGFTEQFIQRKKIIKNGADSAKDTNDSSVDFELIIGGQKSYPKK